MTQVLALGVRNILAVIEELKLKTRKSPAVFHLESENHSGQPEPLHALAHGLSGRYFAKQSPVETAPVSLPPRST
jgi:hypothetical protein